MASNNSEINAAVNEATKALGEMYPEDRDRLLDEAYAKRGLKRRKRLSPEEKAARDRAEVRARNEKKIFALAAEAGLEVVVADEGTNVSQAGAQVAIRAVSGEIFADETDEEREARERYQEAFAQEQEWVPVYRVTGAE